MTGSQGCPAHLVPLGRTGWSLWREGALRGAGFPADGLLAICDRDLADAVDDAGGWDPADPRLAAAWQAATARLSAAVAAVAADPVFREAVAWQNPALIETCLDKLVRGEPRNVRGRLHESTVVRYLQRYLLKNDTIGFFGPVGWVTLDPGRAGLEVTPGEELLVARTTHFEMWAIDEFARALASRPELAGWLVPRRAVAAMVTGNVLHWPLRPVAELTEAEAAVFGRCDGRRTVLAVVSGRETASGPAAGPVADGDRATSLQALARLAQLGAVHIGLDGPVDSWPERALRHKLEAIGDEAARRSALASLESLTAARDAIAAARDAEDVVKRTGELAQIFEEVTTAKATRRPGQAYAGRTLVYQDTRRDVDVTVGRAVLGELAAPLGLVLDSARWLVARIAEGYQELFAALYDGEAASGGVAEVPLGHLFAGAAPELDATGHTMPSVVQTAIEEFQRRWLRALPWPDGVRRHSVTSAALAAGVTREFGGAVVPWRAAMHHSPDLMIAAADAEAVRRGDFLFVLGELHMAVNTLDNRFFVQHHDDPRRLLAAAEADFGDKRIYAALPKSSPWVSSRVWPPITLLSPRYTYWSWSGEPCSVDPPGPVLSGAGLTVRRRDGALRVVSAESGAEYDLLEILGEVLITAAVNSFRPFAAAPHRPRITIDRLVVSRESWAFGAADTKWAFVKDEAARYAAARSWRASHGLPERMFAVLPVERKPIAVNFTSLPLVNILAKEIRRTAEAGAPTFSVSEMLPDLGEMWLPDHDGRKYASEFRLVAVDESARASLR
ncbi:MAG TPA: lantibiotic dehydratase [Streptosporangiaceae bacterium]